MCSSLVVYSIEQHFIGAHTAVAEQLIAAGAATDITDNVSTCVSSDTDMLCC